jgi:hypothetical protein
VVKYRGAGEMQESERDDATPLHACTLSRGEPMSLTNTLCHVVS